MQQKTIRIAGVQGFYGDSPMGGIMIAKAKAADYLMLDALSELTLSILQKDKLRDSGMGYARDIALHAARLYPLALKGGIRIVASSGGLNPRGAAEKVKEILGQQGIVGVRIAVVEGDNMISRLEEMKERLPLENLDTGEKYQASPYPPSHANVYTGAASVKAALDGGADIVLTGRVADPCLALGILAHEFDWKLEGPDMSQQDLDRLASGIMIGHILECGGQASGGNAYSEWEGREYKFSTLGYPIAECKLNGEATISKLPGTGGKVSRNTIREQLVYEIHNPFEYITPDVTADFSEIEVTDVGPDMVKVRGAKGKPRPEQLKLCIGQMEGYMTEQLFYFSWPYAYEKAKAFAESAREIWQMMRFPIEDIHINYMGINGIHDGAAPEMSAELRSELNEVGVRLAFKHKDKQVGKQAIQSIVCLGLNGPPGISAGMNWGKAGSVRLGLFPTLIPRDWVEETVTMIEL